MSRPNVLTGTVYSLNERPPRTTAQDVHAPITPTGSFQIKQMTLLNGGQWGGNSPTKLRVLGAARKSEVKATQNLSTIVAFFAVCWMPLYTINCVQAFCDKCPVPASMLHACIILSHLNSAGNPLLYAYHLKDFRKAFKTLLTCKGSRHRNDPRRTVNNNNNIVTSACTVDCSASSLTASCSGGSVDCWPRWSGGKSVVAGPPACRVNNNAAVVRVDPSAPVLLSVRKLVE